MNTKTGIGDLSLILANERDAPPVDKQPRMEVHSWRLMELPSGDQHLVTLRDGGIARVTSRIAAIDYEERTLTTSSDRVYAVLGPPEVGELESRALKAAAAKLLGCADALDVSFSIWGRMRDD